MLQTKKRLITAGILICLGGILFEALSSWALDMIMGTFDPNAVRIAWIAQPVVGAIRYGAAALGASLIAIGIAIHWLSDHLAMAPSLPLADKDRPPR